MKKSNSSQRGQIALIIILLMVVIGTIALSVVSRSVVDIGISTQEENKIRAFSQAEAGIEDLLTQGLGTIFIGQPEGTGTLGSGEDQISYNYKIESVGSGADGWILDEPLANGETTEIKLQGGGANPASLKFYWINTAFSDQQTPKAALEISVYNSDNTMSRYAVAASGEATADNGFSAGSGGGAVGGKNYQSTYDVILGATATLVRVKALYNRASLAVVPQGGSLPVQGYQVTVTGQQQSNTAAVQVVQALPANAGIFDYVLWSGSGLSK